MLLQKSWKKCSEAVIRSRTRRLTLWYWYTLECRVKLPSMALHDRLVILNLDKDGDTFVHPAAALCTVMAVETFKNAGIYTENLL